MTGNRNRKVVGFCIEDKMDTAKALNHVNIKGANECWNWLGSTATQSHYGNLRFNNNWMYAHRFAWENINGEIPKGFHVLHHCDNPLCCNPNHLYLGTVADNMRDRDIRGRSGTAKFNPETVKEIRTLYATGLYSYPELAGKYSCFKETIARMVRKETWKWVE